MIDVTVLLLDDTFASTAIGPMEVFRHAGTLWNYLTGNAPGSSLPRNHRLSRRTPRHLRWADPITASGCDHSHPQDRPHLHSDHWAEPRRRGRTQCGRLCRGCVAGTSAEPPSPAFAQAWGWSQLPACSTANAPPRIGRSPSASAQKYPKVKWMPELMVTEDHGFYCGGGVHAALDLSLYLVEKFCGHEIAMQSAKAMLIDTPRAWQAGFAIVPLKTEHSDDSHLQRAGVAAPEFSPDLPARGPGPARGHEPAQLRPPLQASHRRQPADLLAETPRRRRQASAGKRPSHHAGDQRRRRLSGRGILPGNLPTPHRRLISSLSRAIWSLALQVQD